MIWIFQTCLPGRHMYDLDLSHMTCLPRCDLDDLHHPHMFAECDLQDLRDLDRIWLMGSI